MEIMSLCLVLFLLLIFMTYFKYRIGAYIEKFDTKEFVKDRLVLPCVWMLLESDKH